MRAELLEQGGPGMWAEFMDELRAIHLHGHASPQGGVRARLGRAQMQQS